MGYREIIIKQTSADNIAAIAWIIESKGLLATADKFTDDIYDYFIRMADKVISQKKPLCIRTAF